MSLQDYRNKFPEYDDIPDDLLVQGLYKKYGEAEKFEHFSEKLGYVPEPPPEEDPELTLGRLGHQVVARVGQGIENLTRGEKILHGEREPLPETEERAALREKLKDDPYYQVRQQAVQGLKPIPEYFPEPLSGSSGIIEEGIAGAAEFAPAMVGQAVNPVIGAAAIFETIVGSKHKEFTEQGIDNDRATKLAIITAGLTTPIEFAGNLLQLKFLGKLASKLSGKRGGKIASAALNLLKVGVTEGGEEFLQTPPEEIVNIVAANPDVSAKDIIGEVWGQKGGIGKRSVRGFGAGAVGGVALAGAGGVVMSPAILATYRTQKQIDIDAKKKGAAKPTPESEAEQTEKDIESGDIAAIPGEATGMERILGKKLLQSMKGEETQAVEEQDKSIEKLLGVTLLKRIKDTKKPEGKDEAEKTGLEQLAGKALLTRLKETAPEVTPEEAKNMSIEKLMGIAKLKEIKKEEPTLTPEEQMGKDVAALFANYVKQLQGEPSAESKPEVPVSERKVPVPEQTAAPEVKPEKAEKPKEKTGKVAETSPKGDLNDTIDAMVDEKNALMDNRRDKKTGRVIGHAPIDSLENSLTVAVSPSLSMERAIEGVRTAIRLGRTDVADVIIKRWENHAETTHPTLKDEAKSNVEQLKRLYALNIAEKPKEEPKGLDKVIPKKEAKLDEETIQKAKKEASDWAEKEKTRFAKVPEKPVIPVREKPQKKEKKSQDVTVREKKSRAKSVEDVKNLRAAIKKLGRIKWGKSFLGERKNVSGGIKKSIFYSKGLPWDTMERELRDSGWLDKGENLIEAVQNKDRLLEGRRTRDVETKAFDELTEKDKKFKEEMAHEAEAPPKGEYVQMNAEDLPKGKKLTLIDDKTREGWDVYEVTEKDPFGITLVDGTTIELKPMDKVQVRKEDLGKKEKPKLELKGEEQKYGKKEALSASRRTKSAGLQQGLGLREKAPKNFKLEGERVGKKEAEGFGKKTGKSEKPTVIGKAFFLKGGWKPITSDTEIKRGKSKGKHWVTLTSGKRKKVDTDAIRKTEGKTPLAVEYTGSLFDEETLDILSKEAEKTNLTAEQVDNEIRPMFDRLGLEDLGLKIVTYQAELPKKFKQELTQRNIQGRVNGALWNNNIYIVANNIPNIEHLQRLLPHELFHYGLKKMLGEKEYNRIMGGVYKSHMDEIKKAASKHDFDYTQREDRYFAAEEWLAQQAETNPEATWVQKLISAIRKVLRRFNSNLTWSDAEIVSLIQNTRGFVQRGGKNPKFKIFDTSPQFQVDAFHGGGVFRKFSDKFMKSGTGGHVFGWGHYVSEEKGVAKYYNDLYAKEKGGGRFKGLSDSENKAIPDWAKKKIEFGKESGVMSPETETQLLIKNFEERIAEGVAKKRSGDSMQLHLVDEAIKRQKETVNALKKLQKSGDFTTLSVSAQYKVKLFKGKSPDEYTFLDWDKPVPDDTLRMIKEQADAEGINLPWGEFEEINQPWNFTGEGINNSLWDLFSSAGKNAKEATSKFLNRAGISGIRYPVGTLSGGQANRQRILEQIRSKKNEMHAKELIKQSYTYTPQERSLQIQALKEDIKRLEATLPPEKKNYVIFDPKNIEIMEGPGLNEKFKPNIPKKEVIAFSLRPFKVTNKDGNIDPDKFESKTGIKWHNTEKRNPKDLYRGAKWVQTIHDIVRNHPTFTATWEAQLKRVATTHQTSMLDKERTRPYFEADKKSKDRINKAFIDGDVQGKYFKDDVLKTKYELSDEEILAYRGMAEAMETKLDTLITGFMTNILDGDVTQAVIDAVKTTRSKQDLVGKLRGLGYETDSIEDGIHWIHKWANERKGYIPHKWDSDWVVKIDLSKDDAVRNLFGLSGESDKYLLPIPTKGGKYFPTRKMRIGAAERSAEDVIKKKFGWDDQKIQTLIDKNLITVHETRKLPVDLFSGARVEVVKSLATKAANKAWEKYKKSIPESEWASSEELKAAINQNIEEMYLGKGFGQHLIARKGFQGYRTDLENVFSEYMHGFNAFVAKGEAATDFANALKDIDPIKTPKLWSYAKEYIQDMLGESSEAGWFKKIAGTYFLAADLSAATLNMTQNWTHAVPLLKALVPKTDKITAEREISRAMMDVSKEYLSTRKEGKRIFSGESKWITKEESEDMRQALEKGQLDPAFFEEVTGFSENKIWQSYTKKAHMSLFLLFRGAEALNRTSTFISALRRGKRSGLDRDAAIDKAAEIVLEAHFPYGRGNRPLVVRKTGAIGNIGFTFMTYPVQNIVFLKHRFEDIFTAVHGGDKAAIKASVKTAGSHLSYVFAFGGLIGLPFAYLAQTVLDIFDDDDDDWEMLIRKHTPKTVGRAITRGLPAALLGNDMSWRVQGTDAIGMPVGFQIGQMLYKRGNTAWKLHGQGEDLQALFHIMPDMLRNPYKAIAGFKEGGTRRGLPSIKYTAGEAVTRGLGFTPTREAESMKAGTITKKKRAVRSEKLADFAERLLIARRKRNRKAVSELKRDVRAWNRKQRKKRKEGIVIPWKTIVKSAKSRKKYRSKGYSESFPKYMQPLQKETKKNLGL